MAQHEMRGTGILSDLGSQDAPEEQIILVGMLAPHACRRDLSVSRQPVRAGASVTNTISGAAPRRARHLAFCPCLPLAWRIAWKVPVSLQYAASVTLQSAVSFVREDNQGFQVDIVQRSGQTPGVPDGPMPTFSAHEES